MIFYQNLHKLSTIQQYFKRENSKSVIMESQQYSMRKAEHQLQTITHTQTESFIQHSKWKEIQSNCPRQIHILTEPICNVI